MSENMKIVKEMSLGGTEDGKITVAVVEEPYGPDSENVVSVGISLQGDAGEPDWKVHIPKSNIDEVIEALQKAKESL